MRSVQQNAALETVWHGATWRDAISVVAPSSYIVRPTRPRADSDWSHERRVYAALRDHDDTRSGLISKLRLTPAQVRRAVEALIAAGSVTVTRRVFKHWYHAEG